MFDLAGAREVEENGEVCGSCMESKRERRYLRGFSDNGAYAPTPYIARRLRRTLLWVTAPKPPLGWSELQLVPFYR